jgi:hypothetical protein
VKKNCLALPKTLGERRALNGRIAEVSKRSRSRISRAGVALAHEETTAGVQRAGDFLEDDAFRLPRGNVMMLPTVVGDYDPASSFNCPILDIGQIEMGDLPSMISWNGRK